MKPLVIALLFLLPGSLVLGQSFDISNLDNKNNLNSLNLHWATAKLCKKYYEEHDLLTEYRNKSTFKLPGGRNHYACNVCVELVKDRHHSYFEYFVHRFLKDKRIQSNRTNAFTVRALRKEIEEKHLDLYKKHVDAVDSENMVFYKYDLITGYDFDNSELYVRMFYPHINKIAYGINGYLINAPFIGENGKISPHVNGDLGTFKIPMSEERAQEVYDRYKNHFRPNPPFGIATKLYYAIRMAEEQNGEVRSFEIVLKKAEFFLPLEEDIKYVERRSVKVAEMEENVFAEIVFDTNQSRTEDGYLIQKIKSINAL